MDIMMKRVDDDTLIDAMNIWNDVVLEGRAFPQLEPLDETSAKNFFDAQTYTGVAIDEKTGSVVGMYILHPNNVGRCGHICNASYAVKNNLRGMHIGEYLVRDCMARAREFGYRILQFNAVVASNAKALRLYARLGFTPLGTIKGGFLNVDGEYEDIIPHYIVLKD